MAFLEINNVSKRYNGQTALKDIQLSLNQGNTLCLLGPSGCGKTTLLRIIAGLIPPDSGEILINGRDLKGISPHVRRFGLMFQDFALFPHKNVFDNVAFGLKMQGSTTAAIAKRTLEMLTLVGLAGFETRNVAELSGGERQRVALARSLAPQPQLIMLDEPLGSLDRALRQRLMMDLIEILRKVNLTAILVTHDQTEAFAMADTIAVMHAGRIEQIAPPFELYRQPVNFRVARFLGFENLIVGKVIRQGRLETCLGEIPTDTFDLKPGQETGVILRQEAGLSAMPAEGSNDETIYIEGTVVDRIFCGYCYRVRLMIDKGLMLTFDLPHEPPPPLTGASINLALTPSDISITRKV